MQVDVYTYKDVHYLTLIDCFSSETWARRLLKVGVAGRRSGAHKAKVLEEYMRWESARSQVPEHIRCDNEAALLAIPHKSVNGGPVLHPQAQAAIERAHLELAKLCRIHDSTPDKVARFMKANLNGFGQGGGGARTSQWTQNFVPLMPTAINAVASGDHTTPTKTPGPPSMMAARWLRATSSSAK